MMVSWAEIKIICLVSQSTMTKIVSNLENNEVHKNGIPWSFRDRKLFERSVELVMLWLRLYTSDTELTELLYISIEARPGISMAN